MKRRIVLLALAVTSPVAAKTSTAVPVMRQSGPSVATGFKVPDHLVTPGLAVRLADQGADPASARDTDPVVMSSSVSGKDVKPGWHAPAVPPVTWDNDLLDDLAMTGKRHDVDFGEAGKERFVRIVDALRTMAAGLPAGIADVCVTDWSPAGVRPFDAALGRAIAGT